MANDALQDAYNFSHAYVYPPIEITFVILAFLWGLFIFYREQVELLSSLALIMLIKKWLPSRLGTSTHRTRNTNRHK